MDGQPKLRTIARNAKRSAGRNLCEATPLSSTANFGHHSCRQIGPAGRSSSCFRALRTLLHVYQELAGGRGHLARPHFTGHRSLYAFISQALAKAAGNFADSTFSGSVQDLLHAAAAMSRAGMAPGLLIGHSLGGATALAAAGDLPSVTAVVTIAAPFDVNHVAHLFEILTCQP